MRPYAGPAQRRYLQRGFAKSGKALDMGKSCIHFRTADDLPLPLIGELVASTTPDQWIASARAARTR